MDQLKLNGIEVECIIGDQPEERENEQRLLVDVALDIDLEDAAESDRLDDTVSAACWSAPPGWWRTYASPTRAWSA